MHGARRTFISPYSAVDFRSDSSLRCIFPAIRCCHTTRSDRHPGRKARARLVADFDWEHTVPEHALAYRFDIILRGRDATPLEK